MKRLKTRRDRRLVSSGFDEVFYRVQISERQLEQPRNALSHFLLSGWKLGLDPSSDFSCDGYLAANPDVRLAGINPFVHFLRAGIFEGRRSSVDSDNALTELNGPASEEKYPWIDMALNRMKGRIGGDEKEEIIKQQIKTSLGSGDFPVDQLVFDPRYYVKASGLSDDEILDLEKHFREVGWREGVRPVWWFDPDWYLAAYPDIAEANAEPFGHFVEQGFAEGRTPLDVSYRASALTVRRTSLSASDWKSRNPNTASLRECSADELRRAIAKDRQVVLVIGHDDYRVNPGGIQLFCRREQLEAEKNNVNYVQVHPLTPLPTLATSTWTHVKVLVNGIEIDGIVEEDRLCQLFTEAGLSVDAIVMHSAYGHHALKLSASLTMLKPRLAIWYLHDYSIFCANPKLSLESLEPCGNPSVESGICRTCQYGRHRKAHVSGMESLIAALEWEFIAPSVSTLTNFARWRPSAKARVVPHGFIEEVTDVSPTLSQRKLRIAFVGQATMDKGWLLFRELASIRLNEFEFIHLGPETTKDPFIEFVRYDSRSDELDPAITLLQQWDVDAVVVWPTWEETFSFVTFEALGAGCAVITNPKSGNVVDACGGRAIVHSSPKDLVFDSELDLKIRSIRDRFRSTGRFIFSGLADSPWLISNEKSS